jgi:hypothetical protein
MRKIILQVTVIIIFAYSFSGCMGMMLGGMSSFPKRTGAHSFNAPFIVVLAAARGALTDQGLPVIKETSDKEGDDGKVKIDSRFSDGKELSIMIASIAHDLTEVRVKVGSLGDEERSQWIINEIGNRLSAQR